MILLSDQGNAWQMERITVQTQALAEIRFLFLAGAGPDGNIAVDDVSLAYGACVEDDTTTMTVTTVGGDDDDVTTVGPDDGVRRLSSPSSLDDDSNTAVSNDNDSITTTPPPSDENIDDGLNLKYLGYKMCSSKANINCVVS